MSIISFSQNGSMTEDNNSFNLTKDGPKMFVDSSGIKFIGFTIEDLDLIKKELKLSGLKSKKLKELDNKIEIQNLKLNKYKELTDSLNSQYNKAIEISMSKDGIIKLKEKSIKDLKSSINKWEKINKNNKEQLQNLKIIIDSLNKRMKKRFWTIVGLTTTNILTGVLFVISL